MIRVAVTEDDPGYRASLCTVLRSAPGFELVESFPSGDRCLEAVEQRDGECAWDLLVLDIEMPGTDGIETARRLKQRHPGLEIVMLTVFEEPQTILSAICAGASGYLTKDTPAAELLEQLRVVVAGGAPLTPTIASTVLSLVRDASPRRKRVQVDLSNREREVLDGLVRGLQYKEVAAELGISIDTVRTHVRSLYKKLQVRNVAAAVSAALRLELVG